MLRLLDMPRRQRGKSLQMQQLILPEQVCVSVLVVLVSCDQKKGDKSLRHTNHI